MNVVSFKNALQTACNFLHAFTIQSCFTLPIRVELNIPLSGGCIWFSFTTNKK